MRVGENKQGIIIGGRRKKLTENNFNVGASTGDMQSYCFSKEIYESCERRYYPQGGKTLFVVPGP